MNSADSKVYRNNRRGSFDRSPHPLHRSERCDTGLRCTFASISLLFDPFRKRIFP
jgi:hypothetical protein